jgi:hypothetical protein
MSTVIRRLSLRAHPHFAAEEPIVLFAGACESRRIAYLWRCHGGLLVSG